jgi:hypothetical protein
MSSKSIQDSIRKLANISNVSALVCTVESVDINEKTCYCIPINEDADIPNVRIMAQNENGFLLVPKVGSVVIISFLTDSDAYVSMVSEVSEIQLNGDNYDGLVKINDLVDKLNDIENTLNTHITLYNAHVHSGGTIMGSTGIPAAIDTNTLIPTIKADLENTTCKHGNGS